MNFNKIADHHCNLLPNSTYPGHEKGCKGAVGPLGKPWELFCKGMGSPKYRNQWYLVCCKWEKGHCIPKGLYIKICNNMKINSQIKEMNINLDLFHKGSLLSKLLQIEE